MNPTNVKVVFIAAIAAVLWGGYEIVKTTYTAFAWEKTEGTIVDFEHNVWSCGKGISRCFTPIAGYHVRDNYYTVLARKNYNHNEPKHLSGNKVVVYYSPLDPADAHLGGEYGPMNHGIIIFIIGIIVLLIFWFMREKK